MNISKAKSEKEYRKLEALSSSDLRVFLSDRRKFFRTRVLGETVREDSSRAIMIGHLVHCLLLEPENFDKKYYTSICNNPPVGKMGEFVDLLYKYYLKDPEEKFSEIAKKAYSDSTFALPFKTVLERFSDSNAEDYYTQLIEANSKGLEVVCAADLSISENIIKRIKEDIWIGPIFNKENKNREVKIEKFSIDGVELKAMIDDIEIDHDNKEINISDLKVVYDNQNFYREYYLKKSSHIQAYLYYRAVCSWAKSAGVSEYIVNPPRFIAVDSGCFYRPVTYQLDMQDLEDAYYGFKVNNKRIIGVKEILEEISFCQDNNIWNMTKNQYLNQGKIKLNG